MFFGNRFHSTCFALIVLLSSSAVLAENDSAVSQQLASNISANKESAANKKLRLGPGDPVAGKDKAMLCFGCHGEDGNNTDPANPKLAGQYGPYITKQVRNYLASTRTHMIMGSMASAISDEDMDDISAYYANLPVMKGTQPSNNALGKKLYENDDLARMVVRCRNCHGDTGKGLTPPNPVYPIVGGQHKEYLLGQLIGFKKGMRNNSFGGVMNTTVQRMSDAELEALADYLAGQ